MKYASRFIHPALKSVHVILFPKYQARVVSVW